MPLIEAHVRRAADVFAAKDQIAAGNDKAMSRDVEDAAGVLRPRFGHVAHRVAAQIDQQINGDILPLQTVANAPGFIRSNTVTNQDDLRARIILPHGNDLPFDRRRLPDLTEVNVLKTERAHRVAETIKVAEAKRVEAVASED